jgi:glycosyltransferase involved in cell wall biosynthesis
MGVAPPEAGRSGGPGVGRGPRVLIVVNAEWYFLSHRLSLAIALRDHGCEVAVAAAEERGQGEAIRRAGLNFIRLRLQRRSTNLGREARLGGELFRVYRRLRPDVVHHVSVKPVLYGSVVARVLGVPAVINAVPGLGYLFLQPGLRGALIRRAGLTAYRLALAGRRVRVIVQNPEDREMFVIRRVVPAERAILIRGSGVDVTRFARCPEPDGVPIVLLPSRLLRDKGVGELVEAARRLRREGVPLRTVLVGLPDDENPSSIPQAELEAWQDEGVIEWWGHREDMPEVLAQASIVVLPSYREGVPKALLEGAAVGRPLIATDVPGCREIVRPGENGFLVPPRNAAALAEAIRKLLLDAPLRSRMGARGREIAVAEFSEEIVIGQTLAVYRDLLGDRWPAAAGGGTS